MTANLVAVQMVAPASSWTRTLLCASSVQWATLDTAATPAQMDTMEIQLDNLLERKHPVNLANATSTSIPMLWETVTRLPEIASSVFIILMEDTATSV